VAQLVNVDTELAVFATGPENEPQTQLENAQKPVPPAPNVLR
jgi:hypothetical protein